MTTRKLNKIKALARTSRYPETFDAILIAASSDIVNLDNMTAAQIAAVIDFAYLQHDHGYSAALSESL